MKIGTDCKIHESVLFFNLDSIIIIGNNVRIDANCILCGPLEIGDNVHIAPYCAKYGKMPLIMESFTAMSSRVAVYTSSDDCSGDYLSMAVTGFDEYRNPKHGAVIIESFSMIGTNSTIMPGVKIGKNSIVGAHSYVTKNVDENIVAAGIGTLKKIAERSVKFLNTFKS